MVYECEIQFTLDTICPWTYLAKRRLAKALSQLPADGSVTFRVKYMPYQLYPDASREGEDKFAWYKKSRYGDSDDKMALYTNLMAAYGAQEGIAFKFGGTVANTLPAHRLIQHYQRTRGEAVADAIVDALYRLYFEMERHPASEDTLVAAAVEAGVEEAEARRFVANEDEGRREVELLIREQKANQIDAVPYLVFEGRRRDHQLEGAKEVEEYVSVLKRVVKESE